MFTDGTFIRYNHLFLLIDVYLTDKIQDLRNCLTSVNITIVISDNNIKILLELIDHLLLLFCPQTLTSSQILDFGQNSYNSKIPTTVL